MVSKHSFAGWVRNAFSRWRTSATGHTFEELLGLLSVCPTAPAAPALVPDRVASLLLLRPASAMAIEDGGPPSTPRRTDAISGASELQLEAVFIDGREPR